MSTDARIVITFIYDLQVSALLAWILTCVAVEYGLGRHNFYVPLDRRVIARKMVFFSQPFTICTASLVKVWHILHDSYSVY